MDEGEGWWSEPYLNRTAGSVWRVTYNLRLPRGADGSPGGMVSLDLALDDLVASIESLAYLPGWRALLVAPAGSIAMSSIPEIAQSDTLDDRSVERRVGKECDRTCRSRWAPYHQNKHNK